MRGIKKDIQRKKRDREADRKLRILKMLVFYLIMLKLMIHS